MAGIKVRDAEGNELEVGADEADQGFAAGRFSFTAPKVRMVAGDNRTGYVAPENYATARAQGWRLATEEEAEAAKLRREASSTTGTLKHGALALARGGSLGISDVLARGAGMSAKELAAGQEALGGAGTGLEVAGAIAATALTGGTGGAAQAGVRGGGVAARLAGGAARLTGAPSRLAARAGTAVERAVLGQAEAGIGRRAAASAAGEALDGALGGLGGAVSEAVIHDKPLTAEALLGSALAGAAFGGGVGGVTGAGSGSIARILQGARVKRGGEIGDDAIRTVLARDVGIEPADVPDALVDAAKYTDESVLGRLAERLAPYNGADPAISKRHFTTIQAEPKWARDVYNNKKRIEEELASTYQDLLPRVQGALKKGRIEAGGEAKYKAAAMKMPRNADLVSPRVTEELRAKIDTRLAEMEAINKETGFTSYDANRIREARALFKRAFEESIPAPPVATAPGPVKPKLHDHESAAVASFRALDRAKRDLGTITNFGPPKLGDKSREIDTDKALREVYDLMKVHLEREDVFGAAGAAQREINAAQAASIAADTALKQSGKGSGMASLWNPDGTVNLRQAMNLTRQYQRIGGTETVAKLDEALEAQLNYLRAVEKHTDISDATRKSFRDAEAAVQEIRDKIKSQRKVADFLSDAESLREAESNRSVSMGVASTIGPAVGGLVGAAALGPIGAAAGVVAGGVMRPYTTARSMASLLAMTGSFGRKLDGKSIVSRLRARAKELAPGLTRAKAAAGRVARRAGEEARAAGRSGVRAAAFQIGQGSPEQRAKKAERIQRRVAEMSSPDGLRRAMGPELEALAVGAPEMAAEIEGAVQRAAAYLQANAPKIIRNPFSGRPPYINPRELDQWMLRRAAVVNPGGVVDRIIDGSASREEVECLKAVYPRHFEEMSRSIQDAVAETAVSDPLPYPTLVRLGRLLGTPLDPSQSAERIAATQGLYGSPTAPTPEQKPAASGFRASGAKAIDPSSARTFSQSIGQAGG